MQKEMHVRVNEAGEQGGVAQVDDAGSLRMLDRRADGEDALALDENLTGLEEGSSIDLKQTRGVEHDGRGGGLLGGGSNYKSQDSSAYGQS
jgi:hypothetical protein